MTFLLSVFLAISKRYVDLEYDGTRQIINLYNADFIKIAMSIFAALILVCYIEYTISPDIIAQYNCNYVYITSIFVLLGILRYLHLILVSDLKYSPTEIFYKDRYIRLVILGWIINFVGVIYL